MSKATESFSTGRTALSAVRTYGFRVLVYAILGFILAPLAIIPLVSVGEDPYGTHLPQSITVERYLTLTEELGYLPIGDALLLSVQIALVTAVISTVIGGLAAVAIIRYDFRYASTLETVLLSPLIYPWIIVGISILFLIVRLQSVLGITIDLSIWTVIVGHVAFSVPYPIRTIGPSLANYDYSLDEAARNLGASDLDTYWHVTLPLIKPGIMSGFILVFLLSFNMYIITIFLIGSGSQTMPLLLFTLRRQATPAQLSTIATLLMSGQVVIILVAERLFGVSDYL